MNDISTDLKKMTEADIALKMPKIKETLEQMSQGGQWTALDYGYLLWLAIERVKWLKEPNFKDFCQLLYNDLGQDVISLLPGLYCASFFGFKLLPPYDLQEAVTRDIGDIKEMLDIE